MAVARRRTRISPGPGCGTATSLTAMFRTPAMMPTRMVPVAARDSSSTGVVMPPLPARLAAALVLLCKYLQQGIPPDCPGIIAARLGHTHGVVMRRFLPGAAGGVAARVAKPGE